MFPTRLRPTVWLVLLLAIIQALLPARVQARAVGSEALWQEVCASGGVKRIASVGADGGEQPASSMLLACDVCPLCAVGAAAAGQFGGMFSASSSSTSPVVGTAPDVPSFAFVRPSATGPPAVS